MQSIQWVFLSFQIIGGHVGLPLLVVTLCCMSGSRRSVIVINFCITWILSSVIYSLLYYAGRADPLSPDFIPPSESFCFLQAALISGAQVMTSCSTYALVLYVFLCLSYPSFLLRRKRTIEFLFYILPYVLFIWFSAQVLLAGIIRLAEPEPATSLLAISSEFYCVISEDGPFQLFFSAYIVSTAIMGATAALEIIVLHTVCVKPISREMPNYIKDLLYRFSIFSIYRLVHFILSLVSFTKISGTTLAASVAFLDDFGKFLNFWQASAPLLAFVILASKSDVLRVWCFCSRPGARPGVSAEVVEEASSEKVAV